MLVYGMVVGWCGLFGPNGLFRAVSLKTKETLHCELTADFDLFFISVSAWRGGGGGGEGARGETNASTHGLRHVS